MSAAFNPTPHPISPAATSAQGVSSAASVASRSAVSGDAGSQASAETNPRAPTQATSDESDLHSGPDTLGAAFAYFITQLSPRVIFALAVGTVALRIALGSYAWSDLVIMAVTVAVWPVVEWSIHVFILHAKPTGLSSLIHKSFVATKHRAHHRQPFKLPILFFPARTFIVSVPTLFGIFALTLPAPQAATAAAFTMVMLLRYEWIHFLTHTRYKPRGRWYRTMWRNHRLHHCKNENYWMGVSTTLGDKLLRTFPEPKSVELSPTCRNLGAEGAEIPA